MQSHLRTGAIAAAALVVVVVVVLLWRGDMSGWSTANCPPTACPKVTVVECPQCQICATCPDVSVSPAAPAVQCPKCPEAKECPVCPACQQCPTCQQCPACESCKECPKCPAAAANVAKGPQCKVPETTYPYPAGPDECASSYQRLEDVFKQQYESPLYLWNEGAGTKWIEPVLLPTDTKDRQYKSCAVVGNAGIHNLANYGAEIDQHEAVIRINLGPTWGFESKVGGKTTHRVSYPPFCTATSSRERVTHLCVRCAEQKQLGDMCVQAKNWLKAVDFETQHIHNFFFKGTPTPVSRFWPISNRWTRWVSQLVPAPSSGLYGILYALHTCDSVDIYGFEQGKAQLGIVPKRQYAYFRDPNVQATVVTHKGPHKFSQEHCLIKMLANKGMIRDRFPICDDV